MDLEQPENGLITHNELGSKLKKVFVKNGLELNKRERFFLMSVFDQSKSGHLNVGSVCKALFDEDIEAYFSRKDKRPKGPFFEDIGKENKLTKQQMDDLRRNEIADQRRVGRNRSILQRCKVKLQKAMLPRQMSHLGKWRYFDSNGDGHVGRADVRQRLMQMRVFTKDELTCLMGHFRRSESNHRPDQAAGKTAIQHIPASIGRFDRQRHDEPDWTSLATRFKFNFQPIPAGSKNRVIQ